MTEIRICPEDNLAVIKHEVEDKHDILFEAAYDLAFDRWRDDECEYYHISLTDLMAEIVRMAGDLKKSDRYSDRPIS